MKKNIKHRSARRDKLGILAQMLEIIKDRPSKTQIMYKANLSFNQLIDYLAFLLNNDLIEQANVAGKEIYIITDKGLDLLQRHNELTNILKSTENIIVF